MATMRNLRGFEHLNLACPTTDYRHRDQPVVWLQAANGQLTEKQPYNAIGTF